MRDRRTVIDTARHAARYPGRAKWYLHRLRRDAKLRLSHRDHLAYYGAVVDDLVVQGKATAVGKYGKLREDFYFRTETLIEAASRHGLSARFMDDWEALGHSQSKIRVTLPVG